jgi:hypothetical protein
LILVSGDDRIDLQLIMGLFGSASAQPKAILYSAKSNSSQKQRVWFGFSELLLSSKSNSP